MQAAKVMAESSARPAGTPIREMWEAMYCKWPEGPPYEADREKAMAEARAIRAMIRVAHPGPFPDSTAEIRRSRDADWGEEDDVDS